MSLKPTVFRTATGDPVKPLRVLTSESEWIVFREMRDNAKKMHYRDWKRWVAFAITYAASSKVAKQVGLQTPGRGRPSPLFYYRMRHVDMQGNLKDDSTGVQTGQMSSPSPNLTDMIKRANTVTSEPEAVTLRQDYLPGDSNGQV